MPISPNFRFFADNARGYIEEAKILREEKEYDRANDVILAGLEQYPKNPYLLYDRGLHLKSKWMDDEAFACLKDAHEILPSHTNMAINYADLLHKHGNTGEAEAILVRAFATTKSHFNKWMMKSTLIALGHLYQTSERYQFAASCFGHACILDPTDWKVKRRYNEIVKDYGFHSSKEKWTEFKNYMDNILKELGPAPDPPRYGPEHSMD